MEKMKLSPEDYDKVVEAYRDKYGYSDMDDLEKVNFDMQLDKVLEKDDGSDSSDDPEDPEALRSALEEKYGYDEMSDEEKDRFDRAYSEVIGGDGDKTDESEDIDSEDADSRDDDDFRKELEEKFGYKDMSDAEKERFDHAYSELMGEDDSDEGEQPENTEKVLTRVK